MEREIYYRKEKKKKKIKNNLSNPYNNPYERKKNKSGLERFCAFALIGGFF